MNAAESSISSGGIQSKTNNLNINGCIDNKNCEPLRIVRQYINPAVYVESSVYDMAPFRRSPVFLNYSSDDEYIHKVVKVKKCVCFTNPNRCPCHPSQSNLEGDIDYECNEEKTFYKETKTRSLSSQVSLLSDTDSKITVKNYELKLSLPSTSTSTLRYADDNQREEAYKNWCSRKDQERKLKEERDLLMKEIKQREKELQLQQERENFKRWLTRKKKEEEKRKKDKEKEEEDERIKNEVKEKRLHENELNYQLWLKRKEELYLGNAKIIYGKGHFHYLSVISGS